MDKLFCGTNVIDLSTPVVMGILNLTPDSFFDGGNYPDIDARIKQVGKMLGEGASIIDLGAVSTRPGADDVDEAAEISRLVPTLKAVLQHFPGCTVSVDTFRPAVARAAVENGAGMINDIYGGRFDQSMLQTVASLNVPYILMHMKGSPARMQDHPDYADVVAEVSYFFEQQVSKCRAAGIRQVIRDPGFGFGKTIEQNFSLLSHLEEFTSPEIPLLVGISRKSMIYRHLDIQPSESLNGTTALHAIALLKGADILRVHDVKQAVEAIRLVRMLD